MEAQRTDRPAVRREMEVPVDYAVVRIESAGVSNEVPAEFFEENPLIVATSVADSLFLRCGAHQQTVRLIFEVWLTAPSADSPAASAEVVSLRTGFSVAAVDIWSVDDVDSAVPLPRAGDYEISVEVTGRTDSINQYRRDPLGQISGIEAWRVRLWPASADDSNLEAVAN